ncbi:hypothetical protein Q5H93_04630 [Hymenobacter sp. ASUV-10]|uniref:DUF2339 domain-containing protein n=1 Tax=Hymenobacter aranciens TaxID=3063996 RepID=A0ABT9B720_9BACT|nr:hypothetical protein [Hymenobacter sp. ASUV-10]MDO7874010.1 hypothetical protein [Hymenobacter sp. ASUV-10]
MEWPSGLTGLENLLMPSYQPLVASLLYPAFTVLGLLLIQSFDKPLLTGLLMVEVFAVFSASLLLRRADFRYTVLAGMAAYLVRLVFFDRRQSHTLVRAAVFIFMVLLLLGMNALYVRFRNRTDPAAPDPEPPFSKNSAEPPVRLPFAGRPESLLRRFPQALSDYSAPQSVEFLPAPRSSTSAPPAGFR